jgi:hypothetical protein
VSTTNTAATERKRIEAYPPECEKNIVIAAANAIH